MLIKFLDRGTGSGKQATDYLLREHDHKGEIRTSIKVLHGNANMVADVADSLSFKHRYRSAVLAWHRDDQPTEKQIQEVLQEFERVAFAGLKPNQYTYLAVLHEENDGSKHIHIIVPRVELTTGKSFNIAPPGWQKTYDLIMDKMNAKYAWASPRDEERRQAVTMSKYDIHSNTPNTQAKKLINEHIVSMVASGNLTSKNEIVEFLSGLGEITRNGKDYVSVKLKGAKTAIKLKGGVYSDGYGSTKKINGISEKSEVGRDTGTRKRPDRGAFEGFSRELERVIEGRAQYNQYRYRGDDSSTLQKAQQAQNHEPMVNHGLTPNDRSIDVDRGGNRNVELGGVGILEAGGVGKSQSGVEINRDKDRHCEGLEVSDYDLSRWLRYEIEARNLRSKGGMVRQNKPHKKTEKRGLDDISGTRTHETVKSARAYIQGGIRETVNKIAASLGSCEQQVEIDRRRAVGTYQGTNRDIVTVSDFIEHLDRTIEEIERLIATTQEILAPTTTTNKRAMVVEVEEVEPSMAWGMGR